jgi:uncharacterized protein YceK
MSAHRLFWPCLILGVCVIVLSGCASLPSPTGLGPKPSLADAQSAVVAGQGDAPWETIRDYAGALVRSGEFAHALTVLTGATQPGSPDAAWLNLKAACEGELGDKVGARRDFEAAAALGSSAARANLIKLTPVADPIH